jgi:hypothetical protein
MQNTDSDFLFDGLSPEEAKQIRRILAEWRIGDAQSFPVQLALLTRAQWKAAAQTPVVLKQSLELLHRRFTDYREQTGALLENFKATADGKVKELERVIIAQKVEANATLAALRENALTVKRLLDGIERELTKGTDELKRFRDQFIEERHRLEEARVRCEHQNDCRDWVVLGILLLAMVVIGILIGWKLH